MLKKKALAENLRLLYVATTRAKDKLILTTTDNKNTASSIKTNGYNNFTLPAFYCVSQTSFYSWMLASFARYQTSNIGDIINFKYCNFNCVIKIKNKFCEIKENNEKKENNNSTKINQKKEAPLKEKDEDKKIINNNIQEKKEVKKIEEDKKEKNKLKEENSNKKDLNYSDEEEEGVWEWADGSDNDYENWTTYGDWDLPDNGIHYGGDEDYVHMNAFMHDGH